MKPFFCLVVCFLFYTTPADAGVLRAIVKTAVAIKNTTVGIAKIPRLFVDQMALYYYASSGNWFMAGFMAEDMRR